MIEYNEVIDKLRTSGIVIEINNKYAFTDLGEWIISVDPTVLRSKVNKLKSVEEENNKLNDIKGLNLKKGFLTKQLSKSDLNSKEFKEWVKNWNKRFPTKVQIAEMTQNKVKRNFRDGYSGKYGVVEKMKKWFIETGFEFTPLIVDYSTIKYLSDEWNSNMLLYCKSSSNFIMKQHETSKLLTECEIVIDSLENNYIDIETVYSIVNNKSDDIQDTLTEEDPWTKRL